ncbi:hypothetical protein MLAC_25220 [Mycobacterium lacus]|uniref:Uncharacterized protein n=1 Tax=Mycobacterium lacus TaxID=169765 RepID=A0A7I7NLG7_9MYCO|nr:hypothetical protein MLAC_25220 [Mycobacterium lacus]
MTAMSAAGRPYDTIDLSSRALVHARGGAGTRACRAAGPAPVSWHPPVEDALMPDPDVPGYWAITRRADIVTVSRTNQVFLSGRG